MANLDKLQMTKSKFHTSTALGDDSVLEVEPRLKKKPPDIPMRLSYLEGAVQRNCDSIQELAHRLQSICSQEQSTKTQDESAESVPCEVSGRINQAFLQIEANTELVRDLISRVHV